MSTIQVKSKHPDKMDREELRELVDALSSANESLVKGNHKVECILKEIQEDTIFWQSLLAVALYQLNGSNPLEFTDEDSRKFLEQNKPFVWYSSRSSDIDPDAEIHKIELLTADERKEKAVEAGMMETQPEEECGASNIILPGGSLVN